MSIIIKGMGTARGGGGLVTKGYGGLSAIPPDVAPVLARASITGEPDIIRVYEPITPPDEMRLMILMLIIYRIWQALYWRGYARRS